ncbi:MAG: DUF945 family protein [Campylobacterales bacterium]|nr:DUF945 family protein [Campylobacterales bacterium]
MKKMLLSLLIVVVAVAVLPLIGNSFMKNAIDARLEQLNSYGVTVSKEQSQSQYLNTQRHFEFLLEDADKFVAYLNKYADSQLPPYVNAMFEGVLIGADIEYSNFPFAKAVIIDIYPMSLSEEMSQNLQKEDLDFYNYIQKVLQAKGVLYHIEYNVLSEDFNGYIQDIKEAYTLKDGSELKVNLEGATFSGNGELVAPKRLSTDLKMITIELIQQSEKLLFDITGLKSASNYDSKSTYVSSMECANAVLKVQGTASDAEFVMNELKLNASSNTQNDFAQLASKSSIQKLFVASKQIDFSVSDFNMDIGVDKLDKKSFLETLDIFSKMKNMQDPQLAKEFEESFIALLSKGFLFNIADLSVSDVSLQGGEHLKHSELKSQITLIEDKDFAQKMQMTPLLLASNVSMLTNLRLSEEMFTKITNMKPLPVQFQTYIKRDGSDYIFDVEYKNGQVSINSKVVR